MPPVQAQTVPCAEKMLAKDENFIKLKRERKKSPKDRGEGSMRCKIGLQDGFPTAFAVKEPKDMDGLCSFIDITKLYLNFCTKASAIGKKGLLFI